VDAVWPFGASIKAGWKRLYLFLSVVKEAVWLSGGSVIEDGSCVDLKLFNGLARELLVGGGFPGALCVGVDHVSDLLMGHLIRAEN
jgi:hypothetical protein